MLRNTFILLGLFLLFFETPIFSQEKADTNYSDPSLIIKKLPNGIHYYIWKNRQSKKTDFYLFYDVGATVEKKDEYGFCHLLEHTAFSQNTKTDKYLSCLSSWGLAPGININAATGWGQTQVKVVGINEITNEQTDSILSYFSVIAHSYNPDSIRFENQKKIILREIEENGGKCENAYALTLGRNDITGDPSCIAGAQIKKLKDFCSKVYTPNHLSVIVIGDVDTKNVETMIIKYFNSIPLNPNKSPQAGTDYKPNYFNIDTDTLYTYNRLSVIYRLKKMSSIPQEQIRETYIQDLIRFMIKQRVMNNKQIFNHFEVDFLFFFYNLYDHNSLMVSTNYDSDYSKPLSNIFRILQNINTYGFTQDEINYAKNRIKMVDENNIDNNFQLPNEELYIKLFYYILSDCIPFSIQSMRTYESEKLGRLSPLVINEYFRKIFATNPIIDIKENPSLTSNKSTDENRIRRIIESTKSESQTKYTFKKPTAMKILDHEPVSVGKISEKINKILGTYEWQLPNGLNIFFKKTQYPDVYFKLSENRELYPRKDYYSTFYEVETMLSHILGIGDLSRNELTELSQDKNFNVDFAYTNNERRITSSSSVAGLKYALQQIRAMFLRQCQVNNSLLEQILQIDKDKEKKPSYRRSEAIDKFEQKNGEPSFYDISYITSTKLDTAYNILFSNINAYTLYMAGNINPDSLKKLLCKYLDFLKPNAPKNNNILTTDCRNWWQTGIKNEVISLPKNDEKISTIFICCQGGMKFDLLNKAYTSIIEGLVTDQCSKIIREKQNNTYGVHRITWPYSNYENYMQISALFKTTPEIAEKMSEIALNVFDRVLNGDIDEATFNQVKKRIIYDISRNLHSNEWWVDNILPFYYAKNKDISSSYIDMVNNITLNEVKQKMKELYSQHNLIKLIIQ